MVTKAFCPEAIVFLLAFLLSCSGGKTKFALKQTETANAIRNDSSDAPNEKPSDGRMSGIQPETACTKGKNDFVEFLFLFTKKEIDRIENYVQFPMTVANVWHEDTDLGYTIYRNFKIESLSGARKHLKTSECDILMDPTEQSIDKEVTCSYINKRFYFSTYCNGYFPLYTFKEKENRLFLVAYDLLYDKYNRKIDHLPEDVFLNTAEDADNMAQLSYVFKSTVTIKLNEIVIKNGMNIGDYLNNNDLRKILTIKIENKSSKKKYKPNTLRTIVHYGISCRGNYYTGEKAYSGPKVLIGPGKSHEINLDLVRIQNEMLKAGGACREIGHFYLYDEIEKDRHMIWAWIPIAPIKDVDWNNGPEDSRAK